MRVPMVDIGIVGVAVRQLGMLVRMAVRLAWRIARTVLMPVVRVVLVAMRVQ